MIIHDCIQGSPEWAQLRIGMPTASCFDQILTPSQMKPSKSQDKYLARLIAEWSLGQPMDNASSQFMDRGKSLEAEALNWFEWEHNVKLRRVGFITDDTGSIGCSPDALDDPDGGAEVKCLNAENHTAALLSPDMSDYRCQIQGCLMITERKYWTRIYYNPTLPSLVLRIERDEPFIAILRKSIDAFLLRLEEAKRKLVEMGFDPSVAPGAICRMVTETGEPCGQRATTTIEGASYCAACAVRHAEIEQAIFG